MNALKVFTRASAIFACGCTRVAHFALNADTADSMDMICGGSLSVLMEFVAADQDNRRLFTRLKTMEADHVDEILVPQRFENSVATMTIDQNCYLVILTRGHLHDRTVLAQALRTEAGYIGMIGSKRKRDAIYASLLKDSYLPSDFKRVQSPIGLGIGAETPEEIALSIVSELIAVRASRRNQVFVGSQSTAI